MLRAAFVLGFVFTLFGAQAANVFDVRLAWSSGAQPVDLDLYVKNSRGEIVNYAQRTSSWGVTHLRDDRGVVNAGSFETFSIDIAKMDCAGGVYDFRVSHFGGPATTSTISASQNGASAGSWSVRTGSGQDVLGVTYTAQPQNCPTLAPTLGGPTVSQLVDGNDLVVVLAFPAGMNQGYSFTTVVDVPSNYVVKRVEVLRTALEMRNERLRFLANNLKSGTAWLFADTAIGFIPVVGDLLAFSRGGGDLMLSTLADVTAANEQYVRETTRRLMFVNPRNVKLLLWYTKVASGAAAPTLTTVPNF